MSDKGSERTRLDPEARRLQINKFLEVWEVEIDPKLTLRENVLQELRSLLFHVVEHTDVLVYPPDAENRCEVVIWLLGINYDQVSLLRVEEMENLDD